jgi:hypothetical protein
MLLELLSKKRVNIIWLQTLSYKLHWCSLVRIELDV